MKKLLAIPAVAAVASFAQTSSAPAWWPSTVDSSSFDGILDHRCPSDCDCCRCRCGWCPCGHQAHQPWCWQVIRTTHHVGGCVPPLVRGTSFFFMITLAFAVSVFWSGIWTMFGFVAGMVFWYFIVREFVY